MDNTSVAAPANSVRVLAVSVLPAGKGATVALEAAGAFVVARAEDASHWRAGETTSARLRVVLGPRIDTSPVKRPNSYIQVFRFAWRERNEPRMRDDGWNCGVPELVGWGDVIGVTDFGVIVEIRGIRFEVEMQPDAMPEFRRARRYAFRGNVHLLPVDAS